MLTRLRLEIAKHTDGIRGIDIRLVHSPEYTCTSAVLGEALLDKGFLLASNLLDGEARLAAAAGAGADAARGEAVFVLELESADSAGLLNPTLTLCRINEVDTEALLVVSQVVDSMLQGIGKERPLKVRPCTTASQKVVTDTVVLAELARRGVDKSDVEMRYDYSGSYPRTKLYQNKRTGERVLVSQGLCMARPDDNSLVVPLFEPGQNKWYVGNNLFGGEVSESGRIALSPVVDQPNGVRAGDEVVWEPVLYLDGKVVYPISGPDLLEVDPINASYGSNVLRWDYGICTRLIRLIEGRLCERWYFSESPGGTVRIVHNHIGQFRLGSYAIDGDIEQVTLAQFSEAVFPLVVSATLTVYPDADPESATVDGWCMQSDSGASWSTLVGGSGSSAADSETTGFAFRGLKGATTDTWTQLGRGIFLFDTSAILSTYTITDVSLYVYGSPDVYDGNSSTWHVVTSAPASNTALAAGDYDSLGNSSLGSSTDTTATLATSSVIKEGITKLGTRWGHDISNNATWGEPYYNENDKQCRFAEYGSYKPKLTVTYTVPGWQGRVGGVTDPAKIGGIGRTDIKKLGGVS